jgi:hypothetical protein
MLHLAGKGSGTEKVTQGAQRRTPASQGGPYKGEEETPHPHAIRS